MWNVLLLLYLLIGVGIAWGATPNVKLEISGAHDRQARTRRVLYGVMFLNTALTWPLTAAMGIFMGLTPSKVHAEIESTDDFENDFESTENDFKHADVAANLRTIVSYLEENPAATVGIISALPPNVFQAAMQIHARVRSAGSYPQLLSRLQLAPDQVDQVRVLYEETALPALTLSALASLYEYKEKELKKEGASRKQIITVLGLELSHAAPSLTAAEIQLIEDARTFGVDAIRESAH